MITSFTGPNRFLSNFYIEPDGSFVEYEYQRAKCAMWQDRERFDDLFDERKLTPKIAKAIGRRVTIREDWEDVKLDIMLLYVRKKFSDHRDLWWMLKATGDQRLIEGNTWGDEFWGVCQGRGLNMLGEILMQVRAEL